MPVAALPILVQPLSNSTKFYEALPTNAVPDLAYNEYQQTIQPWQFAQPYFQKLTWTDPIAIQFHYNFYDTEHATLVLDICDKDKNVISAISLLINSQPFYKGFQEFGTYTYPFGGDTVSMVVAMWAFKFGDLFSSIRFPDYTALEGIYYLKLTLGNSSGDTVEYFSEAILIRHAFRNTQLLTFTYNSNNSEKNVVITDWYNDFPDNTVPYNPVFGLRVEAYKIKESDKAVNIGYYQSNYQQLQIKTDQRPFWTMKFGENCLGIPDWILEKTGEALLADNVWYAGLPYILHNPDSKTSLADIFKIKRNDTTMLLKAECLATERFDSQRALSINNSIILWRAPLTAGTSGSIIFPFAVYGDVLSVGSISVTIIPVIIENYTDLINYLDFLNSIVCDNNYLTGEFIFVNNTLQYIASLEEQSSSLSVGTFVVLTSHFSYSNHRTTVGAFAFYANATSGHTLYGVADWGFNSNSLTQFALTDAAPVVVWDGSSHLPGTFNTRVFHNNLCAQIQFGRHYIAGNSVSNFTGNLPSQLEQWYIWNNIFSPAEQTIRIDLLRNLVRLNIIESNLKAFANNPYFSPYLPNTIYIILNDNNLQASTINQLFRDLWNNKDTYTSGPLTIDISGGTNAGYASLSPSTQVHITALMGAPYFWNILTNP